MSRSRVMPSGLAIALDVGGTFTDVTLTDPATGAVWITKTPTTPHDPAEGFLNGVDKALHLAGARPESLGQVLHGTTTATNAILEAKGVRTGLLTTSGLSLRARDRPPRHPSPRQHVRVGEAGAPGPARADRRDPGARHRGRQRAHAAGHGGGAGGGPPAAGGWRRRRSPSASCTPTPIPPTSGRRARSCWKNTPSVRCRCRRRCCPSSASTSGRWPPCLTPTCSRSWAATWARWRHGCAPTGWGRRCAS